MSRIRRGRSIPPVLALICVCCGCAAPPTNPSFPVGIETARRDIEAMKKDPREPVRPILILNGWFEPGLTAAYLTDELRSVFGREDIAAVAFPFDDSFDRCRKKAIDAVDKAFPSDDPIWTTEVDVVGVSMGGLVARYAASEQAGQRRLRIARLFTLATPHRGLTPSLVPPFDRLLADMQTGSDFIKRLDQARSSCRYSVVPYVRLGDSIVEPSHAAPEGVVPRWLPAPPFELGHIQVGGDPRIIADIMRRLRGEEPLTRDPPAPLPEPDDR